MSMEGPLILLASAAGGVAMSLLAYERWKRVYLLSAALGALSGLMLLGLVIPENRARLKREEKVFLGEATALVAARALPEGTVLDDAAIAERPVPQSFADSVILPGDRAKLLGQKIAIRVHAGEVLTLSLLASSLPPNACELARNARRAPVAFAPEDRDLEGDLPVIALPAREGEGFAP